MWREFSSPQYSCCRWYGGCQWSLAVAGQSPDKWPTHMWRLHYQPLLDRICRTLLRKVSFYPLHHYWSSMPFALFLYVWFFHVFLIDIQGEDLLPISHHSVTHGRYSNPQIWRVYSGDVSLFKMSFGVGKTVQKIISHDKFNTRNNDNDIALLKLDTPLTFTSKSSPVKFIFHHTEWRRVSSFLLWRWQDLSSPLFIPQGQWSQCVSPALAWVSLLNIKPGSQDGEPCAQLVSPQI